MINVLEEMVKANAPKKEYHKVIYYEEIIPNPLNKFPITDIEELAENIKREGLMNDLIVYESGKEQYTLIGGERRLSAIQQLIAEGNTQFEDIPCHVISINDELHERILILLDNLSNRSTIAKDLRMMVTKELEYVWNELDKQDKKPEGLKRDWIAAMLGVSPRTAQYYITASKDEEMAEQVNSGVSAAAVVNEVAKKEKEEKALEPSSVMKKLQNFEKYLENLDFDEVFNRCDANEVQCLKGQLNNIYSVISEIRNSN